MTENSSTSETSHFGFKEVPAAEKAGMVKGVFENVAARYDIMNDAMSGGLHRLWKASLIDQLAPRPGMRFLDVAGGTGDIAFRIHDKILARAPETPTDITVCDINEAMLAEGRNRAIDKGVLSGINWICGDAEKLPIPSGTMDAYTIAFGIRNVTNIPNALKDAYRVLRPGGRFLCLEFSHVDEPILRQIYERYSFDVIPELGGLIADDKASYQYLVESIRQFPKQSAFAKMIEAAGFEKVSHRNLSGGIVAIHSGWKI